MNDANILKESSAKDELSLSNDEYEELLEILEESVFIDQHRSGSDKNEVANSMVQSSLKDYLTRKLSLSNSLLPDESNIEIQKINEANDIMINQGPNHSALTKLRQLLRHQRLHEAFYLHVYYLNILK